MPSPSELTSESSLAELCREYLDDLRHRVTPAHHRNVEVRLRRTLGALVASHVSELKPLDVIRYRNAVREGGLSNRSANLVVDSLRSMLTWSVDCGLIEAHPLARIRRLPDGAGHQRYVRRALTDGEIGRFLGAAVADDQAAERVWQCSGGGRGDHRRAGVRIPQAPLWRGLLETGARWSELRRVRWGDVEHAERMLLLRAENTKARRRRLVPLGNDLLSDLEQLASLQQLALSREVGDSDWVFLSPECCPWRRPTSNAMRIFDRVLARAAIQKTDAEGRKLDIHALRHTFGTRMARSGAGLAHVQRLLGHSDPKLTAQVYTHLDVEDLRSAIDTALNAQGRGR